MIKKFKAFWLKLIRKPLMYVMSIEKFGNSFSGKPLKHVMSIEKFGKGFNS